jgi:hypothetical protein
MAVAQFDGIFRGLSVDAGSQSLLALCTLLDLD